MQKETNYALAALDMDGTLLNTAHEVSAYTQEVLRRGAEAGRSFALCTGRCLSELWAHLRQNPGVRYVVGENGACVYDAQEKRTIRQLVLDPVEATRVMEASKGVDACRQCFIDNQSYVECTDLERLKRYHIYYFREAFRAGSIFVEDLNPLCAQSGWRVEKINLYFAEDDARERFVDQMSGRGLRFAYSLGKGLEISPSEATKAQGLEVLCRYLQLPMARVMAVGDGGNDLDMMQAAGFAVAMGNAIDAVRALADAVTDDCDHDGAARAIERYMLGGMPAPSVED